MRDVVARELEPADAEAVAAMIRELAVFHGDETAATATDVLRYGLGRHRLSTVWVASIGVRPCGFATTYDWMNYVGGFPVRAIDLLFVRHEDRGRDIGRTLLRAIGRDAEASACRRTTFGAEADNAGANAFYRRLGFEPRDARANRYVISGDALNRLATSAS